MTKAQLRKFQIYVLISTNTFFLLKILDQNQHVAAALFLPERNLVERSRRQLAVTAGEWICWI